MLLRAEFDRLRVVLVNTRNPLNIGSAARAMSNFGFLHLRVVNPYETAFRGARSAVGALPVLANAEVFATVAEAIADCTLVVGTTAVGSRVLQHPIRLPEDGARIIRKRLTSSRVALLFGSERIGLSNEELSHCHWLMRIPTREEHRSLNLAQAVAICLYELARDPKSVRRMEKEKTAEVGEVERITELMFETLRITGYLKPRSGLPTDAKVRRLVRRFKLSPGDAHVWLGMLRQIVWKLERNRNSPD
jgi:TrmH family RNA methyltransferase